MYYLKPSLFKTNKIWLCLIGFLIVFSCTQPPKAPAVKKVIVKERADTMTAVPVTQPAVADSIDPTECPRGAAEPVVKATVFPNAHFALRPDHITGIETFNLPQGDKITIKLSGCEYYTLTFQIETSRFAADTTDMPYWGNVALLLMREINKGISTPLEIDNALKKLALRLQADKSTPNNQLKLNEEIDFGGPDPRQILTIDRISQPVNQRYIMQITFSYGPI
jgi:hypothetical protein